ncbi:MAG: type II secretion system protein [bacterium]
MSKQHRGFTLIELLVVVSIIAILIVVVFESLDPLKQFREARNSRRWSQVNTLSTGIYRYIIEKGRYPIGLSDLTQQLGTAKSDCDLNCPGAESKCLDIQADVIDYLPILPTELNGGSAEKTGYTISKNSSNNVITISSCGAENGASIFIMR